MFKVRYPAKHPVYSSLKPTTELAVQLGKVLFCRRRIFLCEIFISVLFHRNIVFAAEYSYISVDFRLKLKLRACQAKISQLTTLDTLLRFVSLL